MSEIIFSSPQSARTSFSLEFVRREQEGRSRTKEGDGEVGKAERTTGREGN
jgi:hypothetical protein